MTRILVSAAVALVLVGSGSAYAAGTTHMAQAATKPVSTSVDYVARCTSLADQWKTAESAHASNASLGKAKADAAKAAKLCGSTKASDHKKGATDYEGALKLLGVTPA
jgi:hypothetical protein